MSTTAAPGTPRKRLPFAFAGTGDERLAALVASGHERAFAAIYSRYHQPLYRYCLTMVRNESDAQDALQSAFTAAFTALREGRRNAPLRPWLFRIAHNEAISLLRRRRPEATLTEVAEFADLVGVEERVGRREELQLLVADLRELPDRQRAALVMRELSGLSHEDIALALEVSTAAAKQTIFEARRSLMEFAAGREASCDEIREAISDGDGRAVRARRVRAHLRGCEGCTTFAEQVRRRRSTLRAIAPPLPALLATELLGRVLHSSAAHGGGAPMATAGAAGKLTTVAFSAKSVAGVAIVLSAGAGVGDLLHTVLRHHGSGRPTSVHAVRVTGASARRSTGGATVSVSPHMLQTGGAAGLARTTTVQIHRLSHGRSSAAGKHQPAGSTPGASAGALNASGSLHGKAGSRGASGAHSQAPARTGTSPGSRGRGSAKRPASKGSAPVVKRRTHTHTLTGRGSGSGSSSTHATRPTPSTPPAAGQAGTSGGAVRPGGKASQTSGTSTGSAAKLPN